MMKRVFPVIAVAVFSTMLGMGILNPIMALYAKEDLGAVGIWIGLIGGGYHLSRAVLMPLIGRWSDQKGRKIFLGVGLFLYAGISVLYIFAENLPWLFTARLLHGAVSGMIIPVARAWVADISPRGQESRWQGYFNTAFFTGSATGPFLGGLLSDIWNIDAAFAAMGALNLIAFLLVMIFLRDAPERKEGKRPKLSFRALGSNRLFLALFIQRTALELSIATFIFFLPLFADGELGLSRTYIGALVGGALLLTSWLQLFTGRIADRFDKRKLIIMSNLLTFTVIALIPHASSVGVLVALIVVRSLGGAISMPSAAGLNVFLGRRYGMGSTIALLGLATSVGMGIGPIVAGPIYDFGGGITSVFYYAAGVGFVGLLGFAILSAREDLSDEPPAPESPSGSVPATDS
jgi:MFS transporter, DHA1 family, multidrug resistance protein